MKDFLECNGEWTWGGGCTFLERLSQIKDFLECNGMCIWGCECIFLGRLSQNKVSTE